MLFSAGFVAVSLLVKLIIHPHCIQGTPHAEESVAQVISSAEVVQTSPCDTYQIISARGTGEAQSSGSPDYANLIKIVEATIPGGSNMEIQYSSMAEYIFSPSDGADSAASYLSSQMLKCPNQIYVLVGYSKGAMVITELMNKLPIDANQLAAVVLFGNPFHISGAPQNRCSGTYGSGLASTFAPSIPSKYVPLIYDCCFQWDMVCQTIGIVQPHLKYGGSRDEVKAAAFVLSQLQLKLDRNFS